MQIVIEMSEEEQIGADRMIITKTCNTCEHYPNDQHCTGCEWDKSKGENTKWELKENPIVIERAVLDKIRDEIEELDRYYDNDYFSTNNCPMYKCNEVLQIIDKYRKGERNERFN